MNERITLIALFDEQNMQKIKERIKEIDLNLCKLPYGKRVEDRYLADTLPYHFTLFACSIKKEKEVMDYLNNMTFAPFKIVINNIDFINGEEESFELRFCIERNKDLYNLQKYMYDSFKVEHYNPDKFHFHITIHCDKDKKKIEKMKEKIEKNFMPFELEVSQFGLFEIYPANLIKIVKSK